MSISSFDTLVKKIAQCFEKNNWQLVTAESCTGGLIASYLTEIPGSSSWFERGYITYSNLAKEELLSVPKHLIEAHGAVSEPVALAMATGALENSMGHVAVAVTGIAGPGGGTLDKPVGTVCFGWAFLGRSPIALTKQFTGTRREVRVAASHHALSGILSLI